MTTTSKKKRIQMEEQLARAGKIRAADVETTAGPTIAPARVRRKKVSAKRAVKAVGALAAIGTAIAAEKVKQTIRRGRRAAAAKTAAKTVAKTAGKAALAAGLSAAVRATADELRRRR